LHIDMTDKKKDHHTTWKHPTVVVATPLFATA